MFVQADLRSSFVLTENSAGFEFSSILNRNSKGIPHGLLQGQRVNQENVSVPFGRRKALPSERTFPAICCRVLHPFLS